MAEDITEIKEQVTSDLAGAVKELQTFLERKPRVANKFVGRFNTYYDEKYAVQLLPHILAILQDKKPRLFKFDSFPSHTRNTLYQRLFYSFKYLKEVYIKQQYSNVEEQQQLLNDFGYIGFRKIGMGVVVELTGSKEEIKSEVYEGDTEADTKIKWRRKVDSFLEDGPVGEMLKLRDVKLNAEDIEELNTICSTYPNLIYNITRDSISILKATEEQYKKATGQ